MVTASELRARARASLGNSPFHDDWLMGLAVCLVGSLLASVCPFILMGPVSFGLSLIFLKKARGGDRILFEDLFVGFDIFGETLVLGLMQMLIPMLWCFIPIVGIIFGIRKTYSFALASYIKVDSPQTDWRECLDRSTALMEGHRWELFRLHLSFIGWVLLGMLTFGLSILWVNPYQWASVTHFYEVRRTEQGWL